MSKEFSYTVKGSWSHEKTKTVLHFVEETFLRNPDGDEGSFEVKETFGDQGSLSVHCGDGFGFFDLAVSYGEPYYDQVEEEFNRVYLNASIEGFDGDWFNKTILENLSTMERN